MLPSSAFSAFGEFAVHELSNLLRLRTRIPLLVGLWTLAMLSQVATTQSFYGSVVGTVTDSSSAVVPGAIVTLSNTGTSEKKTTLADAHGSYQFVNLVPGSYRVDVEKSGFRRVTRTGIRGVSV